MGFWRQQGGVVMKLRSGNEQVPDVPIRKPTTEETFHIDPLITWVATVALVLIFILVALSLAAWREQRKQTEAVHGVQYSREKTVCWFFPERPMNSPQPFVHSTALRSESRRTRERSPSTLAA